MLSERFNSMGENKNINWFCGWRRVALMQIEAVLFYILSCFLNLSEGWL